MTIYSRNSRARCLLAGALVTIWFFGFLWLALAVVEPLEQTIIEMRQK